MPAITELKIYIILHSSASAVNSARKSVNLEQ